MERKYITPIVVFLIVYLISNQPLFADHPSVGLTTGAASPITTTSAETLAKGQWSLGFQVEYNDNNAISSSRLIANAEADEESDVHSISTLTQYSLNIATGITDNFSLAAQIPYVKRSNIREAHHDADDTEIEELGDSEGIGDVRLFGKYRFMKNQVTQMSTAILFGIKIPTGQTNEESPEEKLEAELQPGSGSWDPFVGLAYSKRWNTWSFDSNVTYQLVNEGTQNTDLGDFVGLNAAFSHRIITEHQHSHHDHIDFNWDLILELNNEWREKEDNDGETNQDSGGLLIFLSPGVRISANGFSAALSIGIPIIEDLNGLQSDPKYRVIANASLSF